VRAVRGLGGLLLWVLATLLLVLAVVLAVTVVLLPVGLVVGWLALRLYRAGLRLLLPRPRDVARAVRSRTRRWRKEGLDRPVRTARKRLRGARKKGRKALRRLSR